MARRKRMNRAEASMWGGFSAGPEKKGKATIRFRGKKTGVANLRTGTIKRGGRGKRRDRRGRFA